MSVLIKNMEILEHCGYCRFRYDGICHALQKTQYSVEECPLVSVNDIKAAPTIEPQQWIPVKMRPMDSEEREYWEEHAGFTLTDDMTETFDCPMPDDGQRIWVQTKNGFVFDDVCDSDCGGIGLEGNGDWDDIVAWMPMIVPEPWKGGAE